MSELVDEKKVRTSRRKKKQSRPHNKQAHDSNQQRNPGSKMVFIGLSLTDIGFHSLVNNIKSDILSLARQRGSIICESGIEDAIGGARAHDDDSVTNDACGRVSSNKKHYSNIEILLSAAPTIKLHLTLFRPFDTNDEDIVKINNIINDTG